MNQEIKILIADDHPMFIEGIRSLLKKEKKYVFVGEAHNGNEAIALIQKKQIDILITDISMPECSGTELTQWVKANHPDIKVLVLTMYKERSVIKEILKTQAEGYILKNTGREELIGAIDKIIDNGTYYSLEVLNSLLFDAKAKKSVATSSAKALTPREIEIVRLISEEYTTAGIAEKLFISPRTVDTHRKNILEKTDSKTIVGLMKFAFENNLLG